MTEERGKEAASPSEAVAEEERGRDSDRLVMYRTKQIQFLGRTTPIVLQNDNGPCPLLAICNILLLRNAIQLDSDAYDVSQDRLLHLVADRLLDSNCNVKSKDEGYVSNQQQNISDAIDLLPRLATGIDVNVLFRKINDFEFTRECAIFDLLDIGLYHGWIVEPEDTDTAAAIGSKSYNALVGELVALESSNPDNDMSLPEEDTVDFAAAKAATLGIPHPSFSTCRPYDNQEGLLVHDRAVRKGDLEEEAELMKALQISSHNVSEYRRGDLEEEAELMKALQISSHIVSEPVNESSHDATTLIGFSSTLDEGTHYETPYVVQSESLVEKAVEESENSQRLDLSLSHPQEKESLTFKFDGAYSGDIMDNDMQSSGDTSGGYLDQPICEKTGHPTTPSEMMGTGAFVEKQSTPLLSPATEEFTTGYGYKNKMNVAQDNSFTSKNSFTPAENLVVGDLTASPSQPVPTTCFGSAGGSEEQINVSQDVCSSLEGTEPIYEGEERIIDSGHTVYENREPVYEGEAVLANKNTAHIHSKTEVSEEYRSGTSNITSREGKLIRDFLKDNASQLTICGLFRLQEGLKDRELCVFFRNNHFSTMFKFKEELYLLATDQGYINQSDLVWEKLNEVNGDSVFMTGDFKEFRVDSQVNDNWSQQNAVTVTADYLSTIKAATEESTTMNSDLQLAIALQEQEFEQQNQPQPQPQPQPQQPQNSQLPSGGTGRSRLIVGPPQMPRSAPPTEKPDSKKEKCILM